MPRGPRSTLPNLRSNAEAAELAGVISSATIWKWTNYRANRYIGFARHYTLDDLRNDCYLGILKAARVYNPNNVPFTSFETYALYWANSYMSSALQNIRVVRRPRPSRYVARPCDNPDRVARLAERTGRLNRQRYAGETNLSSFADRPSDKGDGRFLDKIAPVFNDPSLNASRNECADAVREAMRFLHPQHYVVVSLRSRGFILDQIAGFLQVTRERVRQLEVEAHRRLRNRLFTLQNTL